MRSRPVLRRPILGLLGMAAAILVIGFAAGFAVFVRAAMTPGAPPPQADGIVALTGGAERVETALRLLASGRARVLLVSGVAHGAVLADLTQRVDLQPAAFAGRITLGRTATNTYGNAEETASWARGNAIRTLIVVTAGYHMPRALLELRRALPGVVLYPDAVQPLGLSSAGHVRRLCGEYLKLLGAWAGLSQITPQPVSTALRRHGAPAGPQSSPSDVLPWG